MRTSKTQSKKIKTGATLCFYWTPEKIETPTSSKEKYRRETLTHMSEAPPAYYEVPSEAPPAYSDASIDLAAKLEQMKEMMHLEKGDMMWKMHLQKEEMMDKMEKMRLEKDAMMEKMRLEKDVMMEKMRLEKDTMMEQMRHDMEKRLFEEKERIQTEKKEFIAKGKHWSSNFDSWDKRSSLPVFVRSIVSTFLKTIPTETLYAIHCHVLKDYGIPSTNGYPSPHGSQLQMYIATNSKVYTMSLCGDLNNNYRIDSAAHAMGVFKEIVTFPSEPTPTFWRAVYSQMVHQDGNCQLVQGTSEFVVQGNNGIYRLANAKLEALFQSFR
jgi:hypothetical protein